MIYSFHWMQPWAGGYTPHIGCYADHVKGLLYRWLWITREKLWITVVNWGELVQFGLWMPGPIPPDVGVCRG
jgi:hypothetical protein